MTLFQKDVTLGTEGKEVIYLIRKTKDEKTEKRVERRKMQSEQAKKLLLYGLALEYQIHDLPGIEKEAYGKPYFPEYPQIHFNYSHADPGILCGIAEVPVGVDIERRLEMKERLEAYICHENEQALLQQMEIQEQQRILSRIWTGKESYLKCTGTGIRQKLSDLDLSGCLLYGGRFQNEYTFRFWDGEDYTAAVCVRGEYPQDAKQIQLVDWNGKSCVCRKYP